MWNFPWEAKQQIKFFVPSGACNDTFLAYWDKNASVIPLVDLTPHDPRQVVTVQVNGKEMTALIDSGAPTSMITLSAAARAGVTPKSAGVAEMKSSGEPVKHHGQAWIAQFESFSIGGETIKNPKIGIADLWGAPPSDGGKVRQAIEATSAACAPPPPGMGSTGFLANCQMEMCSRLRAA